MPKQFLEDMVKNKRAKEGKPIAPQEVEVRSRPSKHEVIPPRLVKEYSNNRPRFMLWFVAVASLLFFLFALSYLFSSATITINPKVQDVVFDENLSASLNGESEALPFDLVIISGEETKTIEGMETKNVSLSAEGIVVLYNTFSSASQLLSIDTRLEGSNGKIYKTKTRITVPGMASDGTPGSVEVKVYASGAGAEYNSEPPDFKIFGFKGTPKYAKFYGRSKGPLAGGFKGELAVISDSQKTSAVKEMKDTLRLKLFQRVTDQIPDGFILFKDAVFLNTNENNLNFTASSGRLLPLKLSGTLYGILFDEKKLSQQITKSEVQDYDGSEVYIPNIRDLAFSLFNQDSALLENAKNIEFNVSGASKIVWKFDGNKLREELLGGSKENFNRILSQYPNIVSAELKLSPFGSDLFQSKSKK